MSAWRCNSALSHVSEPAQKVPAIRKDRAFRKPAAKTNVLREKPLSPTAPTEPVRFRF